MFPALFPGPAWSCFRCIHSIVLILVVFTAGRYRSRRLPPSSFCSTPGALPDDFDLLRRYSVDRHRTFTDCGLFGPPAGAAFTRPSGLRSDRPPPRFRWRRVSGFAFRPAATTFLLAAGFGVYMLLQFRLPASILPYASSCSLLPFSSPLAGMTQKTATIT